MRVTLSHITRLEYAAEVMEGVMDARLGPLSDDHQRWSRFELRAQPNASVSRYVDGFGNAAHLITLRRPHRFLEVTSHGEVETLLVDPFALPSKAPPPLSPAERADYLLPIGARAAGCGDRKHGRAVPTIRVRRHTRGHTAAHESGVRELHLRAARH